jgi:DNA-binding transcriptional ArsR family regulator
MVEQRKTSDTGASDSLGPIFSALADPTRREILERLRGGETTVGRLAEPFPISLAAISKHLRVLEGAGLLRRDVRGREHVISLEAAPLREAAAFALDYREFWNDRLDALDAMLRRRKRSRSRGNSSTRKRRRNR